MDKLVLEALEERGSIETFEFAKELGKDHQSIVGSVKSIHALGDVSLFSLVALFDPYFYPKVKNWINFLDVLRLNN